MNKAIIRGTLIENIVVGSSATWTPPVGTVAVDDLNNEAQIGGTYVNGVFSPASPPADKNPIDDIDRAILKVCFNHENRIRALEGKAAITADQFKTAWRSLL